MGLERDILASRVGNLSARTSVALARHDAANKPVLTQDLLAPLGAERAISCVELRSKKSNRLLSQLPPAQGCALELEGEWIILDVTDDGDVTLHVLFNDHEVVELAYLRRNLSLAALLVAFAVAGAASFIGFRVIINRPLNRLLSAIKQNMDFDQRQTVAYPHDDEIGEVIKAFNDMLIRDGQREQELEDQVEDRTSELQESTAVLSQSESNLRHIVEDFPAAIYVQIDNHIVFVNAAAIAQNRANCADDLIGVLAFDLIHPSGHAGIEERRQLPINIRRTLPAYQCKRLRLDGSEYDSEGTSSPVLWEGKSAILIVVVNITEQKRTEQALRDAKENAEIASHSKSAFLNNMSHELRTPLNSIIGFSDLLNDQSLYVPGDTTSRQYANHIYNSGEHLLALINDILDISKIGTGTNTLREEEIDTVAIIDECFAMIGGTALNAGVALTVDIKDEMLPMLRADKRRLKQVLLNLLSNAIKFTKSGGTVTVKAWHHSGGGFVLQVIDTGIGIASADIPKALDRFHQIDNAHNRKYQGTGLGLPLSKALVEQHGGALVLQSQVGVGTTVTVRFPSERVVEIAANEMVEAYAQL